MSAFRQTELCLCGIVEITCAQQLSWFCVFAVGITALNNKVLDDTMDEERVIYAHLRDFQEVVASLWRLVIKGDADIARRGFKQHFRARGLSGDGKGDEGE